MLRDTFIVINFTLHLLRSVTKIFNGMVNDRIYAWWLIFCCYICIYFMLIINFADSLMTRNCFVVYKLLTIC